MSTLKRLSLLSPLLSQIKEAVPQLSHPIDTNANRASCIFAYQAWVTSTADILFNLGLSDDSVTNRLTRLVVNVICYIEPSLVLSCSKLCYDTILDMVSNKVSLTYSDFKDQIQAVLLCEQSTEAFLAPINFALTKVVFSKSELVNGIWRSQNVECVKALQQYFGFLAKLPLSNTMLEENALASYLDMEQNYPALDKCNVHLDSLRCIVSNWFKHFTYDGSGCQHGKGAVSDAKAYQYDKYLNMRSDMRLEYLFKGIAFEGFQAFVPLPLRGKLDRCSKVVFVPKNVSKLRTISMEPASLQYSQQGVMKALYRYIRNHKILNKHIKLEDQTVNQSLAYDGSITNKYATIDLSHASDSVSYDLVKYLFHDCKGLYRWIVGTRSDNTRLPDGTVISLKKYAPMGSALCFPIETIIFAAIAKHAVNLGCERKILCDSTSGQYGYHYSVYGDDIIVPLPIYGIVTEILESLSFEVNQDKSYCDSPFKESCGGNYFCGADITPLRWSCLLQDNGKVGPEAFSSLCSCINNCSERNLRITRAFILNVLRDSNLRPLFSREKDKSPLIFSTHCTNFHLRRLYSKRYQKWQVQYDAIKPVKANIISLPDLKTDDIIYHQYLMRMSESVKRANLTPKQRHRRFFEDVKLTNNMCYSKRNSRLDLDITQPFNNLSILEKVVKFSRGIADV